VRWIGSNKDVFNARDVVSVALARRLALNKNQANNSDMSQRILDLLYSQFLKWGSVGLN
jgi:hypothetical protein